MSAQVLKVEKQNGIATLTLNRPEAMNALSRELRSALSASFEDLQADDAIRVAIVTGQGRAFCAGLDLKELGAADAGGPAALQERDAIAAATAFEGPIIDEGYGMPFSDAMNHESEVASRSAKGVTADQIAARREGVIERGRKRSGA